MPAEPNVVDEANGASDGSNAPTDIPASGNCSSVNGPPTPTYNVENAQKGNGHTPATDMHRLNGTPTTPSNGETPENAARIPKPTPKGKQLDAGARARRSDSAAPAPET
ncbi:hypothetical protein BDV95DRAFT_562659 [Massariosphaeria phaeospora]|uniref:Uncharacterized protein n=1 Tax=Massariosphaeria phaeospora TaxID=100035 RepID=A0A7C8IBW9_9PLEO|nr:hypothetical protein BDV95DRAFT_562659 [Massariosphaeria phaeospora]